MVYEISKYKLQMVKESSAGVELDKAIDHRLNSPAGVARLCDSVFDLEYEAEEVFIMLTLDTKHGITGVHEVGRGTLNSTLVHPREIFKRAILANAAAVMFIHNHPSGDPTPSAEDKAVTERMVKAGKLLGIEVLEHLVFCSRSNYVSMCEEGGL